MSYYDEAGFDKKKDHLEQIGPQAENDGCFAMIFTSPPKFDSHWLYTIDRDKDGMILDVSETLTCDDCKNNPNLSAIQKVNCKHKKLVNTRKSNKRRRNGQKSVINPMEARMHLREYSGYTEKKKTNFYTYEHIQALFEGADKVTYEYMEVDYFFVLIDPNAGGDCYTGIVAGVRTRKTTLYPNGRIIILYIDNAKTQKLEEIEDAIIDKCIGTMHRRFRHGLSDHAIVMFIEAQKAWDADTVKKSVDTMRLYGDRRFENIHFYKDRSKNKKVDGRAGMIVNANRQNAMAEWMQAALRDKRIKIGKDFTTQNVDGEETMLLTLEYQLCNFYHYEHGKNSGWLNGHPRKNNDGKNTDEGIQQDDIYDSFAMLYYIDATEKSESYYDIEQVQKYKKRPA